MQIGTFTNTKDEYVYKTFYRVKDTTEWTEINTSDGSSGAPRDEYPPINYGDWDDPENISLKCEDCNEVILDAELYTICGREDV